MRDETFDHYLRRLIRDELTSLGVDQVTVVAGQPVGAIRYIRQQVFHATQDEFAQVAKVTQASVSRWENGVPPSLDEMRNIRDEAKARGIAWNDSWFFDVPQAVAQ